MALFIIQYIDLAQGRHAYPAGRNALSSKSSHPKSPAAPAQAVSTLRIDYPLG
jgi:hypothetical protein